jgi:hypothetical protein
MCRGYFNNSTSEFSLAHTIAHELAHSIDPCSLSLGQQDSRIHYPLQATQGEVEKTYPLSGVLGCLRSGNSVRAQQKWANPGKHPETPFVTNVMSFPFCNRSDQVTESVADWFAAEVLPTYISRHFPKLTPTQLQDGYSNVWRDDCSIPKGFPSYEYLNPPAPSSYSDIDEEHPPLAVRVNRILLVNPEIRKQLGCTRPHSKNIYCSPASKYEDFEMKPPPLLPSRPIEGVPGSIGAPVRPGL